MQCGATRLADGIANQGSCSATDGCTLEHRELAPIAPTPTIERCPQKHKGQATHKSELGFHAADELYLFKYVRYEQVRPVAGGMGAIG